MEEEANKKKEQEAATGGASSAAGTTTTTTEATTTTTTTVITTKSAVAGDDKANTNAAPALTSASADVPKPVDPARDLKDLSEDDSVFMGLRVYTNKDAPAVIGGQLRHEIEMSATLAL